MPEMKALLEELKALDKKAYDSLDHRIGIDTLRWENVISNEGSPDDIQMSNAILDCILGEIMRAIEAKGWDVTLWFKDAKWTALIRLPGGYIDLNKCFGEEAAFPEVSLLSAYIEALQGR